MGSAVRGSSGARPAVGRAGRGARILVGLSGWSYPAWKAHVYRGVPARRWLAHIAGLVDAVEINGSFYGQIKPETYRRWHDETPAGFRFAVKGHRFVTHYKRLRDCGDSIARLREPASALGDKLAGVIWQLPASFGLDLARLDDFVAALAARWPETRHAIELRHRSWFVPEVATRLAAARIAVCQGDAPDFPMWRAVTTDLVYVRLHGHTRKYASSYSGPSLRRWADAIRAWQAEGRAVQLYFDNDAEGAAVRNAIALRAELGLELARAPSVVAAAPRRGARSEA
jgi:uncharacterized protein YecE (DUF72 family)